MKKTGRFNGQRAVRKALSGILAAVLLAGSVPDFRANAGAGDAWDAQDAAEPALEECGTGDGGDTASGVESGIAHEYTPNCQYVNFVSCGDDISVTVLENAGITAIETEAGVVYGIDTTEAMQFAFTAEIAYGYKVEVPGLLADILMETQERELSEEKWIYRFDMDVSALSTTKDKPCEIALTAAMDMVPVTVGGAGIVSGVDEDGMAQLGSPVSVEVTEPGCTLNLLTWDENGNIIYTAMPLDYENRYGFVVSEAAEFIISDPEKVSYTVLYANERKAKLTGAEGLKLNGLASSAQGYNEIVLNFTAVPNGSDGTERERVYYEVEVAATPAAGETLPEGSSTTPVYYYIPKVENTNTQSKSIKVNSGKLSAPTACTYEFSVKLVLIADTVSVPAEGSSVATPLKSALSGNVITKSFSTKNLYYEDKLGFTKKKTSVYTGQKDVLVGSVKYSKNASYIHDLTAVAYDSRGVVCDGITCAFQNDNDELYVSVATYIKPGKYKMVVYAGIGEEATADSPQGGTMYQSNTSFTLTVEAGINWIDTGRVTDRVVLSSKNVTFSAVPVGYCGYGTNKAKSQKFTYEIKGAKPDELGYGYTVTEPTENVTKNISVNKNGKVTVKKEYNVGTANNYTDYIAVVITAADFQGNTTTATKFVAIKGNAQSPSKIYLTDKKGYKLTGTSLPANVVHGARVVVEDQGGQDMTQYVTITPTDNAKGTAGIYVSQYSSGTANLYVRSCGKVTIKATSKDGKKKTLSLQLEITKPTFNYMLYNKYPSITSDGFPVSLNDYEWTGSGATTTLKYSAPLKKATISFTTGAEINGVQYFSYNAKAYNWFDWAYSITGGTAKVTGNNWTVTPTAKTAELKIWLKSDAKTQKTPKARWTLIFTNDRWGENYESAPQIKLTEGKLYSNKYTNQDEMIRYEYEDGSFYEEVPEQTVTYSYGYLSVRELKWASVTKGAPWLSVSHDRSKRTITLSLSPGNDIKPGSYKYKFAFYDEYGYLYCKPMTITVKINKSSAVKITSSYTMNNSQNGENSVTLKSTPGEFLPDFDTQLMNANVGGTANDFNKYFELAYVTDSGTGKKKAVIQFKSTVTAKDKEELKGKSLTGYVRYSYYYGYDMIENATSKVTIKIK